MYKKKNSVKKRNNFFLKLTFELFAGGKPVTVLTSGAGVQGKTVQLVSGATAQQFVSGVTPQQFVSGGAGQQFVSASQQIISSGQQVVMGTGQQMVVMQGAAPTASLTASDGPVTSDAALAQLAAEAGLLEGEGEGVTLMQGGQVDGGMVTPHELEVVDFGQMDMNQYLNMFSSQLDGDPGDIEEKEEQEQPKENQENTDDITNTNHITNTNQVSEPAPEQSTSIEQKNTDQEQRNESRVEGIVESKTEESSNSQSTNEVK